MNERRAGTSKLSIAVGSVTVNGQRVGSLSGFAYEGPAEGLGLARRTHQNLEAAVVGPKALPEKSPARSTRRARTSSPGDDLRPAAAPPAAPIVVLIPGFRLVQIANGSRQVGWWKKKKLVDEQHELVAQHLRTSNKRGPRCYLPPPLTVTITKGAPRRMDSDNAVSAAKHVRDAIAKWLEIDDGREDLVDYVVCQETTSAGKYWVRITIAPRGAS